MKAFRPAYFIAEAFKGMWRNIRYTVITILVLVACLTITGCAYMIYENVNYNMEKLGLINEITVFIESDVSQERVIEIGEIIKKLDNVDVENVTYVSKDEALKEEAEKYKAHGDLYDILEGDNPYRDSYVIPYISGEGYRTLYNHLENMRRKEITVELASDVSAERAKEIGEEIKLLEHVDAEKVVFISKEEQLAESIQNYSEYGSLTDVLGDENPYKDTYIIPHNSGRGDDTLVKYLENYGEEIEKVSAVEIDEIADVKDRHDFASNIENLKNGVLVAIIVFMIILVIVCVFVIVNTIGFSVMARSEEIVIMRYIGATGSFIAIPFVLEGMIIGTISSIAAYFVQSLLYNGVIRTLADVMIIEVCPFSYLSDVLFWGFLLTGLICGIIGSLMSMKKYIKA